MKSTMGMTIMARLIRNCSNCEIYKTESPNIFVFSSTFCSFVNHNMYKGMKYKMEPSTSLPVYFKINSFMHAAENHMAEQKNIYISRKCNS